MHIYANTSMLVTKIIQALNVSRINTVHGTQCGRIHHFLTQNPEPLNTSVRMLLLQILPAHTTLSHMTVVYNSSRLQNMTIVRNTDGKYAEN
jgi:hypothetical protein